MSLFKRNGMVFIWAKRGKVTSVLFSFVSKLPKEEGKIKPSSKREKEQKKLGEVTLRKVGNGFVEKCWMLE